MFSSKEAKCSNKELTDADRKKFYEVLRFIEIEIPTLTSPLNLTKTADQLKKAIEMITEVYFEGRYSSLLEIAHLRPHTPLIAVVDYTLGDLYTELTYKQSNVEDRLQMLKLAYSHFEQSWLRVSGIHRSEADDLASHAAKRMNYVCCMQAYYNIDLGKKEDAIHCFTAQIKALNRELPYLFPGFFGDPRRKEIATEIEDLNKRIAELCSEPEHVSKQKAS